MVGSAVLSPETDMTTSTSDRHMTARRNQRLAWISGRSCSGTGTAGALRTEEDMSSS